VEPLPPPAQPVPLEDLVVPLAGDELAWTLAPLGALARGLGVSVEDVALPEGFDGSTTPRARIGLSSALHSGNARAATLVHELAHVLVRLDRSADDPSLGYAEEELVVESVAFSVCGGLGIDMTGASIPTWRAGPSRRRSRRSRRRPASSTASPGDRRRHRRRACGHGSGGDHGSHRGMRPAATRVRVEGPRLPPGAGIEERRRLPATRAIRHATTAGPDGLACGHPGWGSGRGACVRPGCGLVARRPRSPPLEAPRAAPTAAQLRYLRGLAAATGTTFTPSRTRAQASREITRLKALPVHSRADQQHEIRAVQADLAGCPHDAVRIRSGETTGYGANARWNRGTGR
jgi:hypothetical protein